MVQALNLRRLNIRHFGLVEAKGLKKYDIEATFISMVLLLNFIKIYQPVQKLLAGTQRQTAW
jgi:hypothetical protein